MIGLIIFLFGLAIGSFLNVVILRLKNRRSFLRGRSFCPKCKKKIVWYDNIPLLSFLLLAGRCRNCRKKISWQYPLVELITALIFIWEYFLFGLTLKFFMTLIVSIFLLIIFVYDLKYYLILDRVTIPAMVIAFLANLFLGLGFLNLISGAIIGAGFFAFQFFISRGKWVGDGDIRLGALMGLILGWKLLLVALFLAYLIGAIFGLILIAKNKKKMSSAIPFGPFLTFATFVTIFYGRNLLNWYLNLFFY
ncbi:MAG: prepilin peptidase [Patescibacteria group bacterium]|jgi:prepilin signal peptidase PulO-like enzyme (type II secretory pathway)